jgi:putative membrane protein
MSTPESHPNASDSPGQPQDSWDLSRGLIARSVLGGSLMGLANLVPGISGGTMLVAAGVYGKFIDAISDLTRLRFRLPSLVLVGVIVASALAAIGGLAWVITIGLAEFRWGMYSLFIGLTLGGVPVMLRLVRPMTRGAWAGVVTGLVAMLAVIAVQTMQPKGGAGSSNPLVLGFAGIAGASAMILPGISGAYLLLLLGQYEKIIAAIKDFVHAATEADFQGALAQVGVLLPVGIGVVVGVALIGNILRFFLHRFEKPTLGVLLGLLIAAPAGLYPFKQGTPPALGENFDGQVVTQELLDDLKPQDWPEALFTPTPAHLAGSLALIAAGVAVTMGVARLGGKD